MAKGFLHKYGNSLSEGIWSLVDQFSFAAGNFALNVYLARTMTHAEYGLFAGIYTAFLLVSSLYSAFFTEPMTVYGSRNFPGNVHDYMNGLRRWHGKLWLLSAGLALPVGAVLFLLGSTAAPSVTALLLFSPLILWQWLVRQACYINRTPSLAGLGGALYVLALAVLLAALHLGDLINAATAFVAMAVASGLSAWYIRRHWRSTPDPGTAAKLAVTWDFHKDYSKSSFPAALYYWLPNGAPFLILPLTGGIESVALLRVLSNLSLPLLQLLAALNRLFVLWFASPGHVMTLRRCSILVGLISGLLALVLVYFGNDIIQLCYGSSYACSTTHALLIGISGICAGQVAVLAAYHKAALHQALTTRAFGVAALVGCLAAYPLTHTFSVTGALATGALSGLVTLGWLLLPRSHRQPPNVHE